MSTEQEQLYIDYWEANREKQGKLATQLLFGIPIGILFSVPVLIVLLTARLWFKRADMVANSQLSPIVLIAAVALIAAFVAVIYKRHQWEMKEQQYLEFKARQAQRKHQLPPGNEKSEADNSMQP
jgi:type VI protein secretion system component VasK